MACLEIRDERLARRMRKLNLGLMKYSAYAVCGVTSESKHEVIEMDDLTSCSAPMVELKTRKRDKRRDGGSHYETLV